MVAALLVVRGAFIKWTTTDFSIVVAGAILLAIGGDLRVYDKQ